MAKRPKRSQSKHDAEVRRETNRLDKAGYDVKADLKGYKQPDTIGGFRPDVVGTKGREREIIEVETKDSVDSARDRKQQQAFRKSANRSKNTTFKRKVTD